LAATAAPGAEGRLYDHVKLRTWRETSGLSLTAASAALGMSYPWLAGLESGRARNPTVEVLTRLAELYGHQPAELLPGAAA